MAWKFYLFLQDNLENYLNSKDYALKTEITELNDRMLMEQNQKKGAYISAMVRKYQISKVEVKWTKEEGVELEVIQKPVRSSKKAGFETFMKHRFPVKGNVILLQFRTKRAYRPEYSLKAVVDSRPGIVTMELDTVHQSSTKLSEAKLKVLKAEAQKRVSFMKKSVRGINEEIDRYNHGLVEKVINLYEERCAGIMTGI